MNLRFPNLGGGVTQGLNDAGIETFEGDYAHYVVRECIQNSLDAAASTSEPVRIEFTLHKVDASALPFIEDLRSALHNCSSQWKGHTKPREFFEGASRIAGDLTLNLLRISDYGTTGVPGADHDENRSITGYSPTQGGGAAGCVRAEHRAGDGAIERTVPAGSSRGTRVGQDAGTAQPSMAVSIASVFWFQTREGKRGGKVCSVQRPSVLRPEMSLGALGANSEKRRTLDLLASARASGMNRR